MAPASSSFTIAPGGKTLARLFSRDGAAPGRRGRRRCCRRHSCRQSSADSNRSRYSGHQNRKGRRGALRPCALHKSWGAHVSDGSKAVLAAPNCDFRYAPEGGLKADIAVRPKRANIGSPPCHSMTSSAVASSEGGTERPRVLAVFRLMTSLKRVGCWIGRSPGFAPFRILST
jgi:hypothetical protein